MKKRDNNTETFLALLRAGLWEQEVRLSAFGDIDYQVVYHMAEDQSVVGLVAAGLEHVTDVKVQKKDVLTFVGSALQLEQRNKAMNVFVAKLIEQLRQNDVYVLLIKGQGIAQCYERPLWRASGDIDLLLSEDNFVKAREFLRPFVDGFDPNYDAARNISFSLDGWAVELHGNQATDLSAGIDKGLEKVRDDIFYDGNVRSWDNNKTVIYLPGVDNDVMIIFTHFLKHFYKGGLGLRQICDWCRLLWTYRDSVKIELLEKRLQNMGLMTEWKAFGAYAVDYLGMPSEAMPLYSSSKRWKRKAKRINQFVLEVGNMGHNRDNSFYGYKLFLVRKIFSLSRKVGDLCRHAAIFPLDSIRFFPWLFLNGIKYTLKGVG